MGHRHHLHPHLRGLALLVGGDRPVLSAGGGMVNEASHDDRAGTGCLAVRRLAEEAPKARHDSFG